MAWGSRVHTAGSDEGLALPVPGRATWPPRSISEGGMQTAQPPHCSLEIRKGCVAPPPKKEGTEKPNILQTPVPSQGPFPTSALYPHV